MDPEKLLKTYIGHLNLVVPEGDESKPWPGSPPHPEPAYVKAQLVMIREKIEYHVEFHRCLVRHSALVLRQGFRPAVDHRSPWGFDVERTVPCDRHLRRKLQYGDNDTLKAILADTVAALRDEVLSLGETVSQLEIPPGALFAISYCITVGLSFQYF